MGFLLNLIWMSFAAPSQMSAHLDQSMERSQGNAYIVRSFVIDGVEYDLDPANNQMVEAIYWYPSGRIRLKIKQSDEMIDMGFSSPMQNTNSQIATYYFPSDFQVIQRNLAQDEGLTEDGLRFRNLESRVMITTRNQNRIFMESKRPQVYINDTWTTP